MKRGADSREFVYYLYSVEPWRECGLYTG